MSSQWARLLLCAVAGLTLLCVLGLATALLPVLPSTHQQARQRWEQRGPRHYEVDATWASGWSYGHVRVEVRNNRVVSGVDLDSGRLLDRHRQVVASFFTEVDNLFRMIGEQIRPAPTWRSQLARYDPRLAEWLSPCAAPLPRVQYDAELGYPTTIDYRGSPCFYGAESVMLKIERFRPLP
jgi:uncharacterized protein DUF6174